VFRHAAEHRHAAAARPDRHLHDLPLLLRLQRGVLAERTEHDQAADARIDQHVDVLRGRIKIERLVLLELCRDGGENALPNRFHGLKNTSGSSALPFAAESSLESSDSMRCEMTVGTLQI